MELPLYLESGTHGRKTVVHALELLGCSVLGRSPEDAILEAPGAIRDYLRFLARHGEPVDPEAPFTTIVVEHQMDPMWTANGGPRFSFAPDAEPLTPDHLQLCARRLRYLGEDFAAVARRTDPAVLLRKPEHGWSGLRIIQHTVDAQTTQMRYLLGPNDDIRRARDAIRAGPEDLSNALGTYWNLVAARLQETHFAAISPAINVGSSTRAPRQFCRRMLEHGWEHLQQLSATT